MSEDRRRRPVIPLTDEQRKLAEENADTIWHFIRRHNLGFGDPESQNDWYCELAEIYVTAARKYHTGIGSFVGFAHCCMWKHVKSRLTLLNRIKRTRFKTISMNAPITENRSRTRDEIIADECRSVEDTAVEHVYAAEMLTQIWPVLTDPQKEALLVKVHFGSDLTEAADRLGIKRDAFKMRIWYARERIKKALPELQFQQGA